MRNFDTLFSKLREKEKEIEVIKSALKSEGVKEIIRLSYALEPPTSFRDYFRHEIEKLVKVLEVYLLTDDNNILGSAYGISATLQSIIETGDKNKVSANIFNRVLNSSLKSIKKIKVDNPTTIEDYYDFLRDL